MTRNHFVKDNTHLLRMMSELKVSETTIIDFNYINHDGLPIYEFISKIRNWGNYHGVNLRHQKLTMTKYKFWRVSLDGN